MSLDDEKRAVVVGLEMEKAYRTFDDACLLSENGRWSSAANRLYYAVFHAVSALLIHDGHLVKSHKGAAVAFRKYYVATGVILQQQAMLFSKLEDLREESDYNCHYNVSADEVTSSLPSAKSLIDTIAELVR